MFPVLQTFNHRIEPTGWEVDLGNGLTVPTIHEETAHYIATKSLDIITAKYVCVKRPAPWS